MNSTLARKCITKYRKNPRTLNGFIAEDNFRDQILRPGVSILGVTVYC